MKDYGVIRVTQGTALGKDDSGKTKLCILANVHSDNGDIEIVEESSAQSYAVIPDVCYIGYITIVHPALIVGSLQRQLCINRRVLAKLGLNLGYLNPQVAESESRVRSIEVEDSFRDLGISCPCCGRPLAGRED